MKKTIERLTLLICLLMVPIIGRAYVSSITSGGYYRLINVSQGTDHVMTDNANLITTAAKSSTDYFQLWIITSSGSGYTIKNAVTGNYIQAKGSGNTTGASEQFFTGSASSIFYAHTQGSGSTTSFAFNNSASTDTYGTLHCDGSGNVVGWQYGSNNNSWWYLEKVTPTSAQQTAMQTLKEKVTLKSGSIYHLTSYYTDYSMTDIGGSLAATATDASAYPQMWELEISSTNASLCAFKNVLTDQYIQASPGTSTQYKMGTTLVYFKSHFKETDGSYTFSFQSTGTNGNHGLHTAASQSYYVVGWSWSADASYWTMEEVTLTSAQQTELTNLKASVNADYTTDLETFFEDAACTTLKSTYATMSDANLRSAMSSLPTEVQNMAVYVKNNTWDSSKSTKWNEYAKDFRIHSYEIFSNCDLWYNKLKIGRFSHLFHPTGVKVSAGDIVYLYVSDDPKDSNASLEVEFVTGTDRSGSTQTLHKGYNAVYVPTGGEVFISYLLNNVNLSCNDYPNITVHIEGGTMNGCFDMRGHGHDNDDWAWLKANMFQDTYLHVKGNSVMLNVYRSKVIGESNAVGVMNIWDFIFDTEQSLAGCNQWQATGQYKMMVNPFDNGTTGTNPFWNDYNHGSSHPGITTDDTFSYSNLSNVGKNGGAIWVIMHELGHGHQAPINLAGLTESSNNSLVQCVNLLAKDNIGTNMFQSTRSSRAGGVLNMISRFNNGYSWIDYACFRTNNGQIPSDDIWVSNRLLYQLWLYFDYLGNYQPTGGNTGFSFMNALYDKMRENGIKKSSDSSNPAPASNDYLLLAKYASQITQTDLREFFQVWGFWELEPTITNTKDISSSSTWFIDDYSSYYIQTSQTYVDEVKNIMAQYSKKADNLMFIEDRGTGSTLATYDGSATSTFGDVGYYGTFDNKVTSDYTATVSGTTVTMSGGVGAVGFKVYDGDGNLVAISNTKSFTVTSAVATGISNGTYTVKVAQGDGDDYIAASPGHTATHYEGETGVPYAMTEPSQLTISTLFTMNCARGYVSGNGSALAGTADASSASKFAIVSYDGNTYLYDATQKVFVCHTTAATGGYNGNAALESSNDFSKAVKNISFGETGFESYPWYMQEDEFTNWLNMDGSPLVYFNRWTDFESGTGGNTYTITITDVDFDDSEAVAMLENYFSNLYSQVENEILPFIFTDPADITSAAAPTIGKPFGITAAAAEEFRTTYATQLSSAMFTTEEYASAKALIDANIVYPEGGKTYLVKNTYNGKYMRVAEQGGTRTDGTEKGFVFADLTATEAARNASAHIAIQVIDSKPYMLSEGYYFNWVYYNYNGYEAYTVASPDKYAHFVAVSPGVGAFSLALGNGEGDYAGYLNSGFYALKNGSTIVAGSTSGYTNQYAQWIFEEFVEGDLDGDMDVDADDLGILVGIVLGTLDSDNYGNADLNYDGFYSVGDITKLVNLMR